MKQRVIFDTNVIVSALLKPGSIPASLVSLAFQYHFSLFTSDPILAEYRQVLTRPTFGFDQTLLNQFLKELRMIATKVQPKRTLLLSPDEPDNRFLECALAAKADYLITGNSKHFPFAEFKGTQIVTPSEFAAVFLEEKVY
jgi:putative PIN family toxin of toxin-antitoxin system